ncbi:MAG: exodeoxyribonuclease VII large subunit [Clostridia bacterium]|nr:exodeoxyribonuclease VII large subunit [Clostridia bacterium]
MSWTLTVSDLNEYVRRSLAGDPMLKDLRLRGEISNFKRHVSGHLYFSLKDEQARIQCVMFRQDAIRLAFTPADGMRVELRGSVSLYTAAGSYQFYAVGMSQDGLGELYQRFEELKRRLMAEGLFDAGRKRPLPLLPRMIGIVTARTGAVIHDIARVAGRRNPGIQLVLRPAQVQGAGAAEDIARGIRELSQIPGIDVLIIGRGGGSLEDLWAFNEEIVVRAVSECPIPVISAVGHETDVTLSDFAADVRAATPSAAAELAVPERAQLQDQLLSLRARALKAAHDTLNRNRTLLAQAETRLALLHPVSRLKEICGREKLLVSELNAAMQAQLKARAARTGQLLARLEALGPEAVLRRGYVIARGTSGRPVTRVADVPEHMQLLFQDGTAQVRTLSTEGGNPFGSSQENL